jgi:tetratricopeptide (TPR) repeat protein
MDVAAWLRDLGLQRYVSAFRDDDIDAEVLPKLTAEDLISIGVASVGHRRTLLDAIASLDMAAPTVVAAASAPSAPAQIDAERRQLTVMFCDVVGATALSTRHDPEDLRELIGDYHRAVAETVGRFDGFVAKYMGDGVLIYFGYPRAHEDDAERAVGAGLAVIEAVGRLPTREDLRVRLGIATGLAVVGDTALTAEIVAEIVERTDGVPLFVEELTKAVLESAGQSDRVTAVLGAASRAAQSVPATLHASLMARLDRLGPVPKETAQIGAVLGREFSYELIEAVVQRPARELQAALARLSDAGLLFCRGTAPLATYLFKHALVQDAAYGTLLRRRRQELHGRVAAALETHFPDLVERQSELLAHHLTAAGDTERAAHQWLKAGQHAAEHSAYLEAIAHLERGLGLLHSLPESPDRDGCEIDLQLALAGCLLTAKGAAAAKPPYMRAFDLAERSGSPHQRFDALYGVWQSTNMAGGSAAASPLSARLLSITEHEGDDGLRLQAHHSAWATCAFAGDPAKTREHTDAGRRLYDPEKHASHRFVYGGHDPGACALLLGAWAEWLLGCPQKALVSISESLALAEQIAHPFTLSLALTFGAVLHLNRREPERALSLVKAVEALVAEQRLSLPLEPGIVHGAALVGQGAAEEAIARTREGVTNSTQLGRPYGLAFLAEGLARHGDRAAALATLQDGLEIARSTGEHGWDAELHRLAGTVLLAENRLDEGEASLQQAIRIAQAQQAKSLELRAVRDLARLWGEQGRRTEAHDLIAPVYSWFTEGFDTADLEEAKALLDQLA